MDIPFLGATSGIARSTLAGPSYRRVTRGVFVRADAPDDTLTRVRAALLISPAAVICGRTAAVLLGLPVDDDGKVHLCLGQTAPRSERPLIRVHRLDIAADEATTQSGIALTTGPRTLSDLAATMKPRLGFEELVAVADVVLRGHGHRALDEAVERAWGRPGVVRLCELVQLADAGADSPAETRMRLRLHAAGFTGLRHGVVVRDAWGTLLSEPDLADPEARVAVQHDGAHHFTDAARSAFDVARDERTRADGWEVVVSTVHDDRYPEQLVAKVAAAYARSARLRAS
ncbi:MAG TPA: hypothetical protein VM097_10335 [Mycobacteriales bacterium]|nr:hypothetical protein [Mycobacteriales bacterium]